MPSPARRSVVLLTALVLLSTACASTAQRDREARERAARLTQAGPGGAGQPGDPTTPAGQPGVAGPGATPVAPGGGVLPGQPGAGAPATGGSAAPGGAGSAPGTGGGGSGGGPVQPGGRVDAPGVTASEVKIGFIAITGSERYGKTFGFNTASYGDVKGQIEAVVAWANARGGLAGRKIVPVIREHDLNNDSKATEAAICAGFTEDDKVFGVVLLGHGYPESRDCYAKARTLVFDPSAFTYDTGTFTRLAPYYWSPSFPSYSRTVRALVPAIKAQGYFTGNLKIGVVSYDVGVYRNIVEGDLRPALRAVGQNIGEVRYLRNTDIPTIQADASQAVLAFKGDVTHVIFVGLGPFAPLFMSTAESQGYRPRYAITSFDSPRFTETFAAANPQEQLKGAVGIGFSAPQDVEDPRLPFPQPFEKPCVDLLKAAGHAFAKRADSRYGLAYCDSVFMLQAAGARVRGPLTIQSWAAAAEQLGSSVVAPSAFATRFGPGRKDGGDGFRYLRWAGTFFEYAGGVRRFG